MSVQVSAVLGFLGDRVVEYRLGSTVEISGTAPLVPGEPGCLSFASRCDGEAVAALAQTVSDVVLVRPGMMDVAAAGASMLAVGEPRLEFARIVARFFAAPRRIGVHPAAVIDPTATIGAEASVGPGVVVGANARIGDRVTLGANAVVGEGCVLGDDVEIGPGTVVGHSGFGYARDWDGTPVLIPHTGSVIVGNRVEIGANAAVDRGTIGDTVVDDDAKIDNLVHIAHNCHVRRGAFVIASSVLCGGVDVGELAWVAPNAVVKEQVRVGDRSVVGLSSTVFKNVPDDATVVGSPARRLS